MDVETEAPLDVDSQQKMAQNAQEIKGYALWSFWAGPAFLLCALAIASWVNLQEMPYWLMASILGMGFCIYYRMRGCACAILLLAVFSLIRHGLFLDHHLLHFGLEGSLACSFFIMALAMDQKNSAFKSFWETSLAQERAITHLEQNLAKLLETSQEAQVSLQEKIADKHKELEEVQSELSSILMLNEVLRKTTAEQLKEAKQKTEALLDRERRVAFLASEKEDLERQLEKLQSDSALIQENEKLLEELNQARCDYAQLELAHEHLHSSYQEKALYTEQIEQKCEELSQEKQKLELNQEFFEEKKEALENEVRKLSQRLEGSLVSEEALKEQEKEIKALEEKLSAVQLESRSRLAQQELLEQKLIALQEQHREEKISWEEMICQAKKEEEDLHAEIGSLNTLGDTLRTIADGHRQELQDKEDLVAELLAQKEKLIESLETLRDESILVQANAKLTEELNTKNYQINELKTAYQNVAYSQEKQARHAEETHHQLCAFSLEKQALQNEIGSLKAENQMLKTHLQQLSEEHSGSLSALQRQEKLQTEKNFLQERLQAAELELKMVSNRTKTAAQQPPKENPSLLAEREALLAKLSMTQEHLSSMEERLKKAAQVEALYQQLRAQFEEKNAILHDTRSQLFHADTELQKLRIEKEQKELGKDLLAGHIEEAVVSLENEIKDLQSENQQLQEMIDQLLKAK